MRSLIFVPRALIVSAFLLLVISSMPAQSKGAQATFSSTKASINDAFSSIQDAERNGGDVSTLIQQLNAAILLVQEAQAENSTNPSQAMAALENATQIAQTVSQQSASVSAEGSDSRRVQLYESIGIIIATVAGSTVAYTQWDPVYRRLWLLVYRKHVVKLKR